MSSFFFNAFRKFKCKEFNMRNSLFRQTIYNYNPISTFLRKAVTTAVTSKRSIKSTKPAGSVRLIPHSSKPSNATNTTNHDNNGVVKYQEHVKCLGKTMKPWRPEELTELEAATKKYGTKWKFIKFNTSLDRTAVSLVNKYYDWQLKVTSLNGGKNWTEEEDRKLMLGIMTFGVGEWGKISDLIETKTNIEVRGRWASMAQYKRGRFSKDEDETLLKLVKDHGMNWDKFAGILNRPPRHLRKHYSYMHNYQFTEKDKKMLHEALKEFGFNWDRLKERFPHKNIRFIRIFLENNSHLNPYVTQGRWTKEEIKAYNEGLEKFGKNWYKISEFIGTRTPGQCSNRYRHSLDIIKRGRWTEEERGTFALGVEKFGCNWDKVSQLVKTRSPKQCCTHYKTPGAIQGRWNEEEKRLFKEGFSFFGRRWVKVSQHVKTRTARQCSNHYKFNKSYRSLKSNLGEE
ncbi:hypothetical protein Glove_262g44 [Diversispora epigaea]|uniref:Uncharacterized protein n=1 Tax=Diversispora epigaea TaxID=1348612 RepID=A0A397IDB3_9GLOM|nr:hypothetical protein Glove_262g44 [Diversispora epigaea]